jgi:hypothetical protein
VKSMIPNPKQALMFVAFLLSAGMLAILSLVSTPVLASHSEPDPGDCDKSVQFGIDAGSPFPPTADHDSSGHATDSLVPRTVVANQGDLVCFDTSGVHQFAAYEPGIEPADIDPDVTVSQPAACPPRPLIDDPDGRVDFQTHPCNESRTYGFDTADLSPGRYLVICTFSPHFKNGDMYGWVIIQ